MVNGGREETPLEAIEWIRRLEALGAGEILLTSMDRDGTGIGYDLPLLLRGVRGGVDSGDRLGRRRAGSSISPRRSRPERTACSRPPSSISRAPRSPRRAPIWRGRGYPVRP